MLWWWYSECGYESIKGLQKQAVADAAVKV